MKTAFLILIATIISLPLIATNNVRGMVDIRDVKVVKIDDKVFVSFDFEASSFHRDYRTTVVPILTNHQGRSLVLPAVTIVGKRKNISDKRTGQAIGERHVVKHKSSYKLKFNTSVPFESWMQQVSISVTQFFEGCCTQSESQREIIAEGKILYFNPVPYFNSDFLEYDLTELERSTLDHPFLHPIEDYSKRYDILKNDRKSGTASVIFNVASSVLDPNVPKNADALNKITKSLEILKKDPKATLKHIVVAGYASPEGSLEHNTKLAEERTKAMKSFIQTRMATSNDHLFELYNGHEDWDGLRKLVIDSKMEYRNEVLAILDSYTMGQEVRKARLQLLAGGKAYSYMLENFYPLLRTAGYVQVYYELERNAPVTAVGYSGGDKKVLIEQSPSSRAVTAINEAIVLMVDENFLEARKIINDHKEDPRTWNLLGVCYMMEGDYENSKKYFNRAVDNGSQDAKLNLKQIETAMKVEKP